MVKTKMSRDVKRYNLLLLAVGVNIIIPRFSAKSSPLLLFCVACSYKFKSVLLFFVLLSDMELYLMSNVPRSISMVREEVDFNINYTVYMYTCIIYNFETKIDIEGVNALFGLFPREHL